MKLSEAILKGCEMTPRQAYRHLTESVAGVPVATCALGAAYQGTFGEVARDIGDFAKLLVVYPILETTRAKHEDVEAEIIALNDDSRWSRERIARWLDEQGL